MRAEVSKEAKPVTSAFHEEVFIIEQIKRKVVEVIPIKYILTRKEMVTETIDMVPEADVPVVEKEEVVEAELSVTGKVEEPTIVEKAVVPSGEEAIEREAVVE